MCRSSRTGDKNKKIGQTQTPGHTRGEIKYLLGVSTPCRLATPAVNLIYRSGKGNNPQSKSLSQEWPNDWHETLQMAWNIVLAK
jgi:hypothetical protein